ESAELIDVAEPRGDVRRGSRRHRSERAAVEVGQWGRHEVTAATAAVLIRDSQAPRFEPAVDVAQPNLVFPRLLAFAVRAAEILTLETGLQAVASIDTVIRRYHRVHLTILVGRVAKRNRSIARRQTQGSSSREVAAGAVVAGVQRPDRVVARS